MTNVESIEFLKILGIFVLGGIVVAAASALSLLNAYETFRKACATGSRPRLWLAFFMFSLTFITLIAVIVSIGISALKSPHAI